jgi:hypothetical protein
MRTVLSAAALTALALAFATGSASAASATPAPPAAAVVPAAEPMTAAERAAVVETLAKQLADNFVFPDVADRYAAMLRAKLASEAYDGLSDPDAFAAQVTADLQAVSKDGHLRLAANAWWNRPRPAAGAALQPFGLLEAKMIGDVAYLSFSGFPDDAAMAAKVHGFLADHADARAVIIDSRGNHGGSLQIMNAMLPLLYAQPTVLVRMDTRAAAAANGFGEDPNLLKRPAPAALDRHDHVVVPDAAERRLQHAPVYYLISHHTGSAAEHLALALKRTHRATLIGETTAGAGHYGGVVPIGDRFSAFIPVGRTYDPDTNWDWEGVGVAPDVAVPADGALDEALKRAAVDGKAG